MEIIVSEELHHAFIRDVVEVLLVDECEHLLNHDILVHDPVVLEDAEELVVLHLLVAVDVDHVENAFAVLVLHAAV